MFVTLETSDFRDALHAHGAGSWTGLAANFLEIYGRNVAIGKLVDALQLYASEQTSPCDAMVARLYSIAPTRVDYYTLALEIVQQAEAANPSLVKGSSPLEEDLDEELAVAWERLVE